MSTVASLSRVPTSFGVFKPTGWLMVGLPPQTGTNALAMALQAADWPDNEVLHFVACESLLELEALVENAGPMAGFGYELTLLQRYAALTRQGFEWLLVKVGNSERAVAAAEIARGCGATLAVHYRTLTVEDLI